MELRHLHTFITIVELDGFTKAAEHLGYAQSTVTAHIQLLEAALGRPLFDRLGKKIVLTQLGRDILPHARQMLALYKDIESMATASDAVQGDLTIGAGESLSIYRLGPILKEFKKRYPKVNIILRNSICSDLRSKIYTGEFDMVFTIEPAIRNPDFNVDVLSEETMGIIAAPDVDLSFLASAGKNIYNENIYNKNTPNENMPHENMPYENIIFSEKGCSFQLTFAHFLKHNHVRYRNTLEFSSIEMIKKSVMNGLGISFLPFYTVEKELAEGNLQILSISSPVSPYCTQLVYHKDKNMTLPMQKFIEITMDRAKEWKTL